MIVIALKFVHIIAISGWSAGLMCLPFLYRQRRALTESKLYRLHNFTRFFYIALVSPAAFIAVATGIALIFVQATFEPWFSVKLALVGIMVIIHVTSGVVILSLFEPGKYYPAWRFLLVSVLTVTVVAATLLTVLGKPEWIAADRLAAFFAPGALGAMVEHIIAWWR